MLILQYPILVLKLSPIDTVSLKTVFLIPKSVYPGTPVSVMRVGSDTFGNPIFQKGLQN